jgi:putative oxidoreductase
MKRSLFSILITMFLVLLFAYTAVSKVLDYELFVFQMKLAPLPLMRTIAPVLGWFMPVLELGLCAGLMIRRFHLIALYSIVCLLLIFEAYIGGMLLSGQHLPCTCGGIISKMNWKEHLLFNAFVIVLCCYVIIDYCRNNPIRPLFIKNRSKNFSRA